MGFRINIVALSPHNIASTLRTIPELCFNVDQPFDLTVGVLTPGDFRNVNVLAVECFPQSCFRVFCAETVQTNIPLAAGRLDAHMSASLDPASRFFHQLHERIKSIWLHSQCRVNRNSQRIPTGQFRLIVLPFLIRNGFVLRILNDRKMMLTAKLIADFCNKTAGVPHIPEFMRAIQRR